MQESFGEKLTSMSEKFFFWGERGGGVISNPQHEEDAKIGCRTTKKRRNNQYIRQISLKTETGDLWFCWCFLASSSFLKLFFLPIKKKKKESYTCTPLVWDLRPYLYPIIEGGGSAI